MGLNEGRNTEGYDISYLFAAYLGQESVLPIIMEKILREKKRREARRRYGCCLTM